MPPGSGRWRPAAAALRRLLEAGTAAVRRGRVAAGRPGYQMRSRRD
jgi:hypothetical protein